MAAARRATPMGGDAVAGPALLRSGCVAGEQRAQLRGGQGRGRHAVPAGLPGFHQQLPYMSEVGARQHPQFSGSGGGSRCSSDGRNSSGSGSESPSRGLLWSRRT